MSAIPKFPISVPPRCHSCDTPCVRSQVKLSNRNGNAGRWYYHCENPSHPGGVTGFSTFDDDIGVDPANEQCRCRLASRRDTNRKDKSEFLKCAVGGCPWSMTVDSAMEPRTPTRAPTRAPLFAETPARSPLFKPPPLYNIPTTASTQGQPNVTPFQARVAAASYAPPADLPTPPESSEARRQYRPAISEPASPSPAPRAPKPTSSNAVSPQTADLFSKPPPRSSPQPDVQPRQDVLASTKPAVPSVMAQVHELAPDGTYDSDQSGTMSSGTMTPSVRKSARPSDVPRSQATGPVQADMATRRFETRADARPSAKSLCRCSVM